MLIIGGSASGKSEFSEKIALDLAKDAKKMYIATMLPSGEEARFRIKRHRELRKGKGFFTLESYMQLDHLKFTGFNTILVECLSNLLANEMFSSQIPSPKKSVLAGIEHVGNMCENLILVTNQIFSDSISYDSFTERYIQTLGEINAELAKNADVVYEVVCGIPIKLKGEDI